MYYKPQQFTLDNEEIRDGGFSYLATINCRNNVMMTEILNKTQKGDIYYSSFEHFLGNEKSVHLYDHRVKNIFN